MRNSLIVILSAIALITFSQAAPSFRILQNNVTVVDNTTTVVNSTSSNNTSGNTTNNGSSSSNTTVRNPYAGYTALNVNDSYFNQTVNDAFIHATNAVVQTAIAQGRVPVSLYNITEWQGVWARSRRGGVNYIFRAHLVSANGVNFYANVTVFHNNTDGSNTMTAYNFRATNITRSMFPSGGYRFLTPAQVHNNTVVQGALVFGAESVIEWLINNKRIPALNLNYTIYNLYLAAYRRYSSGTSYRFQIASQNADGLHVNTNYTVFYRNSNKTYTLTNYWYRAWNFSRSDINYGNNNTNTTNNVTVVNNSTNGTAPASNVTVVDNTTTTATNTTGNVTDANATTGSNSTSPTGSVSAVNVTTPVDVNVNATLVTMDNTTNRSTALVFENVPLLNVDNSTVLPVATDASANSTAASTGGSA